MVRERPQGVWGGRPPLQLSRPLDALSSRYEVSHVFLCSISWYSSKQGKQVGESG
jgi:hypothetical protein